MITTCIALAAAATIWTASAQVRAAGYRTAASAAGAARVWLARRAAYRPAPIDVKDEGALAIALGVPGLSAKSEIMRSWVALY